MNEFERLLKLDAVVGIVRFFKDSSSFGKQDLNCEFV